MRLAQYITNPPNDTCISFVLNVNDPVHYPFATKSGLMEFYNANFTETNFTSASIVASPSSTINFMSAPVAPLAIAEPIVGGYFDPNVTKYPFVYMSTMSRHKGGAMGGNNPMQKGEIWRAPGYIWISAVDAQAKGIVDGNLIKVYNDQGTIIAPAYVTSRLVPGTIFTYANHWPVYDSNGVDWGNCSNNLTLDDVNGAQCGEDAVNNLVQMVKYTS
jgi:anaerobic dimethyl sulfoxide reductase subunit A